MSILLLLFIDIIYYMYICYTSVCMYLFMYNTRIQIFIKT